MNPLVFVLLLTIPLTIQMEKNEGNCTCAVFREEEKEPLAEHTLKLNTSCDDAGAEHCHNLCLALAESVKDNAAELICEKLDMDVDNLMVGVFTKICDIPVWHFTGLKTTQPICCAARQATTCAN